MVDGVAASVYNTAMGGEGRMHAFTAAGRALWRGAPSLLRAAHRLRIAQPISLAVGRFFIKVRISFCGFHSFLDVFLSQVKSASP